MWFDEQLIVAAHGPLPKAQISPNIELEHFYEGEEQIDKHCTPLTWSNCAGNTFDVCRPNSVSGKKAPSGKALYREFGIDTYKSPKTMNKLSQFVELNDCIACLSKKCQEYIYTINCL